MSPETPDDPQPHQGPEHHGVVETLREELHDAVEHVPQPVRWTVGKLLRLAVLGTLLLLVIVVVSAVLYIANRTELAAREITLVVNRALAQHSDLELDMRDIKGNPLTGFRLVEPRVRYRDGGGTLLEAHTLQLGYSAIGLLRGGRGPIAITVEQPIVRLDRGPNGTWRLPRWHGGAKRGAGGKGRLEFSFVLVDARVEAPKPLGVISGIDLRAAGEMGPNLRVELQGMHWRQGPWHSRLDVLRGSFAADADSMRAQVNELRTSDVTLRMDARWAKDGRSRRVTADVVRVRWRWLAEVFDNDEFDVPGEGHAHVDAIQGARWTGRFTADMSWDSLAVAGRGQFGWDGHQLALDSLSGRSLAGDLDGRLHWSRQGWELSGHAANADPAHWHALRLDGWPEGRLNGSFRYVLDSRGRRNSSRLDVQLVQSQWVAWNVDSARVRIEFPAVSPDSFTVVGWRRGGRFSLDARMNRAGWSGPYAIDDFPLDEWPDGRASGLTGWLGHAEGRVDSRPGGLFVTGDLEGERLDWSAAHFARWRLGEVTGRLLPTPDLTAVMRVDNGFFVGVHLDSADAGLHLGNQTVAFSGVRAGAGDTTFTAAGLADWEAQHWHTRLTSVTATSDQFEWVAEPPVEISGDAEGTRFDRMIANDHGAHLEVNGRWASPGGSYDITLAGHALDLARLGMPRELQLAGAADARLAVTGRAGDPRWEFEGAASRPGFGGHAADSLHVRLGGRQHRLDVRELGFGLAGGNVRASGNVDRTAHPWPDSLTATAVIRWLQDAGSWDGSIEAAHMPVGRLGAVAPVAVGWSGDVSGRLVVAGSPRQPVLDLDANGEDLGWRDYRAQRVEVRAGYRDSLLKVPRGLVTMQGVVSTIVGRMPLALALGRMPTLPEANMAWTVDVPRGDLKLLPALVPLIQSARGRFELSAELGGTPRHPRLEGLAHTRDATIRPAGREEVLDHGYADLHFDQSRVVLDSLSARQGRTGRVWAKGALVLNGFAPQHYAFDLRMRDFAASQEGLYAVLFDGDFSVTDGPRVLGQWLPQVAGDVHVQRGSVEFDFANQTEVQKRQATTEPLYWTYNIHLDAARNLRWQPPDGDIEFTAELQIEQTPDSLIAFGDMHLVKGHYFFLSNRFSLSQADLTFDNQKGLDPTIDVIAETRLKPSRSELASTSGSWGSSGPPTETIVAHLTGRSSQPAIELSSSSGWEQREILGELTYGRITGEGVSLADPVQNYLTRQLSNQLSRDLSKFFNDAVNQWELERDQGELLNGAGSVVMSVGGDINARTSWTYRQRLPGLDRPFTTTNPLTATGTALIDRDVEVEYRINRFIYATTELTQRRAGVVLPGQNPTDFNINLKARWEY